MESAFRGTIYEPYDFMGMHTHALVIHVNPVPAQSPALECGHRPLEEMQELARGVSRCIEAALSGGTVVQSLPEGGFLTLALGYTLPPNFSAEQEQQLMDQLISQLRTALAEILRQLRLTVNLSVSALHPNTQNVYDAFREALAIAVHFKFLQEPSQIILYSRFQTGLSTAAIEEKTALERRWTAYMEAKNYTDAEDVLQRIVDIRASAPLTVTSLTQELQGRMQYAIYCLCDTVPTLPDRMERLLDTVDLIHSAKSLEELHQRIHSIYSELSLLRDAATHPTVWSWPRRVSIFIQNNYADPTLSATTLSHRFGINATYLSHIFRDGTGMKLVDYIHSIRIEHIKHLLTGTDMSLVDIATKTGYYDRYSMSRVFRRYVGVTPSDYRRNAEDIPKNG